MIIDSPIISGSYAATGSLNQTGNVVITGSLTVTGTINGSITGSITTASYALNAEALDGLDSTSFTTTSSFTAYTSSTDASILSNTQNIVVLNASASSLDSRVTKTEATASSLTTASSSFSTRVTSNENNISSLQSASGSFSTRTTNLETASGSFSTRVSSNESNISSLQTASGSFSTRVTSNESNISALQTASGSFSTRVTSTEGSVSSLNSKTGSYATTSSNAFSGSQVITGSLTVTGQITAQTLNVQQVTSSIVFSSGSNIFGNSVSNTQQFTGSLQVSGSNHYLLGNVGIGIVSSVFKLDIFGGQTRISGSANEQLVLDYAASSGGFTWQSFRLNGTNKYRLVGNIDNSFGIYSDVLSAYALTISSTNAATFSNALQVAGQQAAANYGGTGLNFDFTSGNIGRIASVKTTSGGSQLQFFVYNTSGTDVNALQINSTGNIGIGTTSPATKLHISNNGAYGIEIDVANEIIQAYNRSTSDYNEIKLYSSNIRFFNGTSSTITERMRITSGGLVGIGTSAPTQKLSVYDGAFAVQSSAAGGAEVWRLTIGTTSQFAMNLGGTTGILYSTVSDTSKGQLAIRDGLSDLYPAYSFINDGDTGISNAGGTANTLNFITGGTERIRITSDGNVGIGTTSPGSFRLDIVGNTSDIVRARIRNTNATGSATLFLNPEGPGGGVGSLGDAVVFYDMNSTAWAAGVDKSDSSKFKIANDVYGDFREKNYFTIQTNGNVGIGTTSPLEELHVFNSTTAAATLVRGTDANLASSYMLQHGGGGSRTQFDGTWYMSYGSAETNFGLTPNLGGGLVFWFTSGSTTTNPMTLKRSGDALFSGNVGIGTTAVTDKLEVRGADNGITISSIVANRPALSLVNGTTTMLRLSANGVYGAIGDGVGADRYMSFNAGNVGVGTTSPSYKLDVNGTGRFSGVITGESDILTRTKLQISNGRLFEIIGSSTALNIYDGSAGGSRMLINSSGNVGIGTTNPTGKLDFGATSPGQKILNIHTDNVTPAVNRGFSLDLSGNGYEFSQYFPGGGYPGRMSFGTVDNSFNYSEKMVITAGGSVGIGTTNPIARLHLSNVSINPAAGAIQSDSRFVIAGVDGNMDLMSQDDNTTVSNAIGFGRYNSGNGALIHKFGIVSWANTGAQGSNTGDRIGFHYGTNASAWDSTELMTIKSGGNVGIGLTNPLATLSTLGGAVQFMGDYRNYATIIKSAGANGTFNGQLTITIPQMSNAASDGYGGYSCEVYVSGFSGIYCHVWFSGYINGGITPGEATILRSNGGWSISQSSFGANNQGFQFVINYPDALIHPTARIIFNKGGSPNATAYPANEITTVWS